MINNNKKRNIQQPQNHQHLLQKEVTLSINHQYQPPQMFTPFQYALYVLQETSLPKQILCRDRQKQQIKQFIQNGIYNQGSSQALYISGVPGIGKTVSCIEVINTMLVQYRYNFKYIYINAAKLRYPQQIYVQLYLELTKSTYHRNKNYCLQALHTMFTTGKFDNEDKFRYYKGKQIIVLLIDQLDYLFTKDQQLLYNLFQWPQHQASMLVIMAISNTMDFPQRLKPKIASRIGTKRIVYRTYTSEQIKIIIMQRLKGIQIFTQKSIQYATRKIATCSSDLRKALQIMRKAVEYAYRANNQFVTLQDIQKAYLIVYDSPIKRCIQKISQIHRGILVAICLEIRFIQKPQCCASRVFQRMKLMQDKIKVDMRQFLRLLVILQGFGLITIRQKKINKKDLNDYISKCNIIQNMITLSIGMDWVINALNEDLDQQEPFYIKQLQRLL